MFPLVSEVVSLLATPQALQMRGGADTVEKMGAWRRRVSKPTGRVLSFLTQCTLSSSSTSAVTRVLRLLLFLLRQRLAWCSEEEPGVSPKKKKQQINNSWYTKLIYISCCTNVNLHFWCQELFIGLGYSRKTLFFQRHLCDRGRIHNMVKSRLYPKLMRLQQFDLTNLSQLFF